MVKKTALILLTAGFLSAGVFDFVTLKEAKEAYEKGEYKKAASLYEKIAEEGSDEARFNAADALYKAGDYKGALKMFESVASTDLKFQKLHNMGNCYAKLGEIDKGIKAYEEALKIKEDKDTRFNLELLKKLKRKQKQQEKESQKSQEPKQNREKEDRSRNSKSGSGEKKQNREQSGKEGESKSEEKRDKGGSKSERRKGEGNMKKEQAEKERRKSAERAAQKGKEGEKMEKAEMESVPISDMELRKWNKELNRRKIQTLMLPLETKPNRGEENEETPW